MIEREKVEKIMTILLKVLFSALFVILFVSVINIEATKKPKKEIEEILNKYKENIKIVTAGGKLKTAEEKNWPPKMNQLYPDIELLDKNGRFFKLSDLKGYIIVLSYVDMSSPISQAQAGSNIVGAYGTTKDIDKNTNTFSEIFRKNSLEDITLPDDNLLELDILVYAQDGAQATVDDAEKWSKHFNLNLEQGVVVAVPKNDLRSKETDKIINGYQLIDSNMMLRVDSAGIKPKHNLKMTLIPLLSKLLR